MFFVKDMIPAELIQWSPVNYYMKVILEGL